MLHISFEFLLCARLGDIPTVNVISLLVTSFPWNPGNCSSVQWKMGCSSSVFSEPLPLPNWNKPIGAIWFVTVKADAHYI